MSDFGCMACDVVAGRILPPGGIIPSSYGMFIGTSFLDTPTCRLTGLRC